MMPKIGFLFNPALQNQFLTIIQIFQYQLMKKIVFVQKEENKYDPVTAFFGKKNPSQSKPSNNTQPNSSHNKNVVTDKKIITSGIPLPEKKVVAQNKAIEITPKIQQKTENQPTPQKKVYPSRQQVLRTRDLSRKNIKKQQLTNVSKQDSVKNIGKKEKKQQKTLIKQDSLQINKEDPNTKLFDKKQQKTEITKVDVSYKAIKELQLRQQQYLRKIEQLEGDKQKYVKNQQKYLKLQKDYKALVQKSKDNEKMGEELKQKQIHLKQILQGDSIPYSRKRQVILANKLRQLKRINRELVLRLKNYKGTDLVQLSIQQNREEIMKELYTVDVQNDLNQQMNVQMESLMSQLSNKLNSYIQKRIKQKGQKLAWSQEQLFLIQIVRMAQKISLNFLNKYEICPLPKTNQQAISAYSLLQQYKKRDYMQKLLDKFEINVALSQQNNEILQKFQESKNQMVSFKDQVLKPKRRKQINDKGMFTQFLNVYQKRANFTEVLLVQNIFQVQFISQWIHRTHKKLLQSINEISKTMAQLKDLVNLGPTGKESLYFYLQNNIDKLQTKFPNVKLSIKQIQNNYRDIQRLCSIK